MTKSVLIAASILSLALAGTFVIGGDHGNGGGFFSHLHEIGEHIHGSDHHRNGMARLIDELELSDDQLSHLERIHEAVDRFEHHPGGSMQELHELLISQFHAGAIDEAEVRGMIDQHLEQIRGTAYAVTGEMVTLINGLDTRQREILMQHIGERHE